MNNGRPLPKDWTGGGENVRGMDMAVLHHAPERFLSAMVFDGVFERFPKLHGGVVELGAGWVPELLHRLDWTARVFGKMQPELLQAKRKPSQQLIDQVGFTPFVFEDVGRLIEQSHEDLYLFSSDYPILREAATRLENSTLPFKIQTKTPLTSSTLRTFRGSSWDDRPGRQK